MKYPLDAETFIETVTMLVENNKMQQILVDKMKGLLEQAMTDAETDDSQWYDDAEDLLKDLHALKTYHESRRFNETNFRNQYGFEATQKADASIARLNLPPSEIVQVQDEDVTVNELSEDDMSRFFSEKRKEKRYRPNRSLKQMSHDEIAKAPVADLKELLQQATAEEIAMDNSNDIYKIKARVANLARGPGMQLTAQGQQLCNTFVHVLKSLYDFADRIPYEDVRTKLISLLRSHENMPGILIAAAGAGVKQADKDKEKV